MDPEQKLLFGDLKVGDKFIVFPEPGDNSGHGGYLAGDWLRIKISPVPAEGGGPDNNYVRLADGVCSSFPDKMPVYKVLLGRSWD